MLKLEIGLPGGDRTPDNLLRRQVLYPTELRAASVVPGFYGAVRFPLFSQVPETQTTIGTAAPSIDRIAPEI